MLNNLKPTVGSRKNQKDAAVVKVVVLVKTVDQVIKVKTQEVAAE